MGNTPIFLKIDLLRGIFETRIFRIANKRTEASRVKGDKMMSNTRNTGVIKIRNSLLVMVVALFQVSGVASNANGPIVEIHR